MRAVGFDQNFPDVGASRKRLRCTSVATCHKCRRIIGQDHLRGIPTSHSSSRPVSLQGSHQSKGQVGPSLKNSMKYKEKLFGSGQCELRGWHRNTQKDNICALCCASPHSRAQYLLTSLPHVMFSREIIFRWLQSYLSALHRRFWRWGQGDTVQVALGKGRERCINIIQRIGVDQGAHSLWFCETRSKITHCFETRFTTRKLGLLTFGCSRCPRHAAGRRRTSLVIAESDDEKGSITISMTRTGLGFAGDPRRNLCGRANVGQAWEVQFEVLAELFLGAWKGGVEKAYFSTSLPERWTSISRERRTALRESLLSQTGRRNQRSTSGNLNKFDDSHVMLLSFSDWPQLPHRLYTRVEHMQQRVTFDAQTWQDALEDHVQGHGSISTDLRLDMGAVFWGEAVADMGAVFCSFQESSCTDCSGIGCEGSLVRENKTRCCRTLVGTAACFLGSPWVFFGDRRQKVLHLAPFSEMDPMLLWRV